MNVYYGIAVPDRQPDEGVSGHMRQTRVDCAGFG